MKRISMAITLGAALALAMPALAQQKLKFAHVYEVSEPYHTAAVWAAGEIAKRTSNRYTVEVYADDKKTEKKDKNINEPVQFYTSKARQPYELVVNEVKKDVIVGYLSTPKVVAAR